MEAHCVNLALRLMQSVRFSRQFRLVGTTPVVGVGVAVPITTRSAVPAVASAHVAVLGRELLTADSIQSSHSLPLQQFHTLSLLFSKFSSTLPSCWRCASIVGVGVAVPITWSAVPAVASAHVAVLGCEFITADSIRRSAANACGVDGAPGMRARKNKKKHEKKNVRL